MATPAISGIDSSGRLVAYINDRLVHVPLGGVITANNLFALGISLAVVDSINGVNANATVSIPAGWAIENIFFASKNANDVTGGIKIGTTSGGTEVVSSIEVPGNSLRSLMQSVDSFPAQVLFSRTAAQTLYVQAVTDWNGASIDIRIRRYRVF